MLYNRISKKHLLQGLTGDTMSENDLLNIYKSEDEVWSKIAEMQSEVFKTSGRNGKGGVEFTYRIKKDKNGSWCGEMFVSTKEKSITRSTVMQAYRKAVELNGVVTGPKKLGTFGASYLYSIFIRLGIIKQEEKNMWKVGNTVITSEMAQAVHDRSNDEWSIGSLVAMIIRDFGVSEEDAEKVVEAVLDLNG